MQGYPENQAAFAHARALAQRSGVDLVRAVVDGWLRRDELAAIVATCDTCPAGFPCDSAGARTIPAPCANSAALAGLALLA